MTPSAGAGICYAVIGADDTAAGLILRHCPANSDWEGPSAMAHIQMRLAIDVAADVGGCMRRVFAAPAAGVVAVGVAAGGGFNRPATDLAHRLGAPLDLNVYGPLVIHAMPDGDGWVGSLSDAQVRLLVDLTRAVTDSISGPALAAA